jgi:putative membrane protein
VAENTATPAERDTENEVEPDYRFTLANERTFLAWQRTALGLIAAAVAVGQLLPDFPISWARYATSGVLTVLAMLAAGIGLVRFRQVDGAMRDGRPLPRNPLPVVLSCGLILVALLGLLLLAVRI